MLCCKAIWRTPVSYTHLEFGGSLSGEHGGGCLKDVGKQLGADELEAMRAVRRLFDPQGILNPGKGYCCLLYTSRCV